MLQKMKSILSLERRGKNMSKILYSLAVAAVVAIALLVGTVWAEDADATASGTVPPVVLGMTVTQGCGNMPLIRGQTASCSDTVDVTANADWKLEVSDNRYSVGTTPKGYMTSATSRATYPFILGVGGNANDLRLGPCVVKGDGNAATTNPATSVSVNVPYSQRVSGSESAGEYFIVLTYTLSARN